MRGQKVDLRLIKGGSADLPGYGLDKWYMIVSDEVTDVSNKEQLTYVLRYVR